MRPSATTIHLLLLAACMPLLGKEAATVAPRTAFAIPLARLSLGYDEATGMVDRVRITYPGDGDQYVIAQLGDTYVEITSAGKATHLHEEAGGNAMLLTDFEAEQLDKVAKTLARTLDIYANDLQRGNWSRCRYLDAFMPRFLNGFYHLYSVARNNPRALPRVADIPDSAYDVSLNSPMSDRRVDAWQLDPEYVVRLRIITRELIYQIRQWQKNELRNRTRNPDAVSARSFEQAFGFFVRMYFNLRPEPVLPRDGEHL